MRKQYFLFVLVVAIIGCKSAPKFSEVTGKEWKLIEVNIDGKSILFDRDTLTNEDAGDIFTFNFDAQNISVKGTTNQSSGRYTLGSNQAISLSPMSSTETVPHRQPEKFKEEDFFAYIQNINRWNLVDTNLELYSKTENDAEVKLVFSF